MLGGSLTALSKFPPAAAAPPLLLALTAPLALDWALRTWSTLPLTIPKPGVTQPPQLQRNPCQANLPMLAPHLGLGHARRPSNPPWASVSFIHDSGCKKIWAQGSVELSADGSRCGGGLCGMMKFDFAIRRRHFRHFSSTSDGGKRAFSGGDDTEMSGLMISESGLDRSRLFKFLVSLLSSCSSLSSSSSRNVMSAISGARFELSASMTLREFIHRR